MECECRFRYKETAFDSLITPLSNLQPIIDPGTGSVEFHQVIIGRQVTLQWEAFQGVMAANGVAFLTISQTIPNPPSGTFTQPITITYNGIPRTTWFYISSNDPVIQGKFYLNTDGSTSGINVGDTIMLNSGSVTWLIA